MLDIYECDKCGIEISVKGLLKKLEKLRDQSMISKEQYDEARKKLQERVEDPFISCPDTDCDGLLKRQDIVEEERKRLRNLGIYD